jgi:hypothetical protein
VNADISLKNPDFVLRGHDCPLGEYPSLAVPVGSLRGKLVSVYAGKAGAEFHPVDANAKFVQHSSRTANMLRGFNPLKHGLFAVKATEVVLYETGKEGEFYARLLRSSAAFSIDSFYRLSLAKETGDLSLIRPAFLSCAKQMTKGAPEFTEMWLGSVARQSPRLEAVISEWLNPPRLERPLAFAAHIARALPNVVREVDLTVPREDAALLARALGRLASQQLDPGVLSGDAYLSAIRASIAFSAGDTLAIVSRDPQGIPSSVDVARISGLSLPLLEFHKIILSKAVITDFMEHSEPRRQANRFLPDLLRPEVYEWHFRRHPVKIRRRQVFTYAEVLSLVRYSGPVIWPSWL